MGVTAGDLAGSSPPEADLRALRLRASCVLRGSEAGNRQSGLFEANNVIESMLGLLALPDDMGSPTILKNLDWRFKNPPYF